MDKIEFRSQAAKLVHIIAPERIMFGPVARRNSNVKLNGKNVKKIEITLNSNL
jgi:hypothetical protein